MVVLVRYATMEKVRVPDLHHKNSWTQNVEDVDPLEMLEVQLCNTTAPFLLISRLRSSMAAAASGRSRARLRVHPSSAETG